MYQNTQCHLCQHKSLEIFTGFIKYKKISSDCLYTDFDMNLCICTVCATIQKESTEQYIINTKKIYSNYKIYYVSNGIEQQVFKPNGTQHSRSSVIIDWVKNTIELNRKGTLLDFGCGNGAFLKDFSAQYPLWALSGLDCNSTFRDSVEKIENSKFFTSTDDLDGSFDVVTLIHCLEHIINPTPLLNAIKNLCSENCHLLIQVPNIKSSLFDALILDHCTHFSIETLRYLLNRSGFKIVKESTTCVNKEITIIAKKDDCLKWAIPKNEIEISKALIENYFSIYDAFKSIKTNDLNPIGIFGASISGTWLAHEFKNQIDFFIDDDENKIGKSHYNIPIISMDNLPQKSTVLIPMPQSISHEIFQRIDKQYRCTPRFFGEHIIALDLTN